MPNELPIAAKDKPDSKSYMFFFPRVILIFDHVLCLCAFMKDYYFYIKIIGSWNV